MDWAIISEIRLYVVYPLIVAVLHESAKTWLK